MGDDMQLIFGVGMVGFIGLLIAVFLDVLTIGAAYYGLGAGAVGLILWVIGKKQYFRSLLSNVQQHTMGTLSSSRGVDTLWEDLQDWESEDPRDTEIIWDPLNTYVKSTSEQATDDEVFYFYSIITPIKNRTKLLHIGIESQTGYIIHHAPVRFKQEVERDPFEYIPFVDHLLEKRRSSSQIMNYMRNASYGRLPGNYGNIDRSLDQSQGETTDD